MEESTATFSHVDSLMPGMCVHDDGHILHAGSIFTIACIMYFERDPELSLL